jgi:anti-anti-sigma factor
MDQDSAGQFAWTVEQCVASGCSVLVVDCGALDFCDSSGLTELLLAHRATLAGSGALHLAGPLPELLTRFSLTGMDQVFSVHPDVAAALDSAGLASLGPAQALDPVQVPAAAAAAATPAAVGPLGLLAELTSHHEERRRARQAARGRLAPPLPERTTPPCANP